jgi:pilus assembly protein Flp/PilA
MVLLSPVCNVIADDNGATAIEYGLIAALIGALTAIGTALDTQFNTVATALR